jgi:HEAT repeat protein
MTKLMGAAVLLALWAQAADDKAAEDKAATEALDKFKAAYKGASADRLAAVNALAQTQHEKTLSKLGNILMGDPDGTVRIAAAKGIGAWADHKQKAAATLLNGLGPNAQDPDVRIAIFKAMGQLEDPIVLSGVHRAFEDKDGKVAEASIECAGEIRGRESIPVLIDCLKDMERKSDTGGGGGMAGLPAGGGDSPQSQRAKKLIKPLNAALTAITLERNDTYKEWNDWWKRNMATFKVPPKPEKPATKKKK